jgi:hypothetical protein
MKIWKSYGAEHSLNLIIVGKFKEVADAEEFKALVNTLTDFLRKESEFDMDANRYSPAVLEYLGKKNLFCLSPQQLGQLLYDMHIEQQGNKILISSDDDLNAFISLLIHQGAKVEVFSAHDYPDEER